MSVAEDGFVAGELVAEKRRRSEDASERAVNMKNSKIDAAEHNGDIGTAADTAGATVSRAAAAKRSTDRQRKRSGVAMKEGIDTNSAAAATDGSSVVGGDGGLVDAGGLQKGPKRVLGDTFCEAGRVVQGLLKEFDPKKPSAILPSAVLFAVIIIVLSAWWGRRKFLRSGGRRTRRADRKSNVETDGCLATKSTAAVSSPDTPSHRTRSTSYKVMILTPEQESLCESLYDTYAGTIPPRGIESKAARECGLTFTEIRRQFKSIKLRREAAFTPAQGTLATSRVAYEAAISPAVTRNINRERLAQQPSKIKPPTKRATVRASPKKSTASPRRTPVKCGALLATSKFPESESGPPNSTMGAVGAARSSKTTVGQRKPSPSKSSARMPTTPESPMNTRGKDRRAPSLPSGPTRLSSSRKKNVAPKSDGNEGERKPSETSPKSTPSKRGASSLLEMARREAQLRADAVADARANTLTGDGGKGVSGRTTLRNKRTKS